MEEEEEEEEVGVVVVVEVTPRTVTAWEGFA